MTWLPISVILNVVLVVSKFGNMRETLSPIRLMVSFVMSESEFGNSREILLYITSIVKLVRLFKQRGKMIGRLLAIFPKESVVSLLRA